MSAIDLILPVNVRQNEHRKPIENFDSSRSYNCDSFILIFLLFLQFFTFQRCFLHASEWKRAIYLTCDCLILCIWRTDRFSCNVHLSGTIFTSFDRSQNWVAGVNCKNLSLHVHYTSCSCSIINHIPRDGYTSTVERP